MNKQQVSRGLRIKRWNTWGKEKKREEGIHIQLKSTLEKSDENVTVRKLIPSLHSVTKEIYICIFLY